MIQRAATWMNWKMNLRMNPNMATYQRASELPRKGISEQERRLRSLMLKIRLPFESGHVFCFMCFTHFANPTNDRYPGMCKNCKWVYNDAGQYCMPDFILGKNVLNLNGGVHEKNHKHIMKDHFQIEELERNGRLVFLLKNEEVDNMTNATLIGYLQTVANADSRTHETMYRDEQEYVCRLKPRRN